VENCSSDWNEAMHYNSPFIVIAAGGDGSRIGGAKPAQFLGGERLIDRMCAWSRRHSNDVAVAVRAEHGDWETGLPLLFDQIQGIGPISALYSGMREGERLGYGAVLLLGCDLPFLPDDLPSRLFDELPGHAAAIPVSNGRLHPMAGLWRCDLKPLEDWIATGGRSLWRYACERGMTEVEWNEVPDPFANINDLNGLNEAKGRLKTPVR
jgi:molybdenum cofactor guanylyltransferase